MTRIPNASVMIASVPGSSSSAMEMTIASYLSPFRRSYSS